MKSKLLAFFGIITLLFSLSCEKKSLLKETELFTYQPSCLNGSWYEDTLHERSRFRDYFYRINDTQLSVIDKENDNKETFFSYFIFDGKITIRPFAETSKKISAGVYPISIIDENHFTIHFPSPMKFVRNSYAHGQAEKLEKNLKNASEVAMFVSAAAGTAANVGKTVGKISSKSATTKSNSENNDLSEKQSVANKKLAGARITTVGDENQDYVYRVIRPDENPKVGLSPKNPNRNMSVEGHITSGSRNNGSQYISTTTDINVARQYAERDGCRIVKIDLNKVPDNVKVYDLSTETGRTTYLKGALAKNFAKASKEVLLEGDIPASAMKIVK